MLFWKYQLYFVLYFLFQAEHVIANDNSKIVAVVQTDPRAVKRV